MKTFVPVKFEDLDMTPEDAKMIADGAAIWLAPVPDPEDSERLLDTDTP